VRFRISSLRFWRRGAARFRSSRPRPIVSFAPRSVLMMSGFVAAFSTALSRRHESGWSAAAPRRKRTRGPALGSGGGNGAGTDSVVARRSEQAEPRQRSRCVGQAGADPREAWRPTLGLTQRLQLNHPHAGLRRWQAASAAPGDPEAAAGNGRKPGLHEEVARLPSESTRHSARSAACGAARTTAAIGIGRTPPTRSPRRCCGATRARRSASGRRSSRTRKRPPKSRAPAGERDLRSAEALCINPAL
jgi:hypothetical protein